ncbi:MAG: hypothetical protein WKG01_26085 [Kofleriaceae bacterium]
MKAAACGYSIPPQETQMEPTKNRATGSKPTSAMQSTSEDAGSLVDDAKGLASQVADRAKDLASERVTGQQEKSAGEIGKFASALHRTSDELSDSMAGPYIAKAAAMLDNFSGTVRSADLRGAVRSTESFARREPLLFLGGAFTLGLLAARFLKSSAHDDDGDDLDADLYAGGTTGGYAQDDASTGYTGGGNTMRSDYGAQRQGGRQGQGGSSNRGGRGGQQRRGQGQGNYGSGQRSAGGQGGQGGQGQRGQGGQSGQGSGSQGQSFRSSQGGQSQTTGSQTTGSQTTGSQTGSQSTGGSQTGSQSTGGSQTGSQSTGGSQTGSQSTGSQTTGSQTTGTMGTGGSGTQGDVPAGTRRS